MNHSRKLALHSSGRRQRGVVLVVALIMLLVMTLLAVGAMRSSNLEERMAGNSQDASVALQAAEAALREGERYLQQTSVPQPGSTGVYAEPDPQAQPRWKTVNWESKTEVITYAGFAGAPGSLAKASAAYFIEQLPRVVGQGESLSADSPVDEIGYYRVTARGVGISGRAQAVLQTTYKR